jgi:hypothetical protein
MGAYFAPTQTPPPARQGSPALQLTDTPERAASHSKAMSDFESSH